MQEKTIESKPLFQAKFLKLREDKVLLPNGKQTVRYIVEHPGAVVVIPLTQKQEVIMVEQFRKPVEKVLLELPAGKLEPGEDPALCAARELKEETGCVAGSWEKLTSFYSTPGFSDEILHLYLATDLKQEAACPDEDEFVESRTIVLSDALQQVQTGKITDAKTIIGLFWAERVLGDR